MAETEELISGYVDRAGITSDEEFLTASLGRVVNVFNELNSLKIKLNVDSSWKEVAATTDQVKKSTDSLVVSLNQYTTAANQNAQAQNNLKVAYTIQNGTLQENARALALVKVALKDNSDQQSLYFKGLQQGEITMDEYLDKTSQLILAQQELRQSQKEIQTTLTPKAAAPAAPAAPVDDPTNANIPFTNNLDSLNAERDAALATGDAVNALEKEQAAATNEATAWGAAQATAAAEVDEAAAASERFVSYTERVAQELAAAKLEMSQNVAAQKELKDSLDQGTISEEQYIQQTGTLIALQKELQVQTASLNNELTAMAKADFAPTNSIDELRARDQLLTQSRNRLTTPGSDDEATTAQQAADLKTINDLLDQNNERIRLNTDAYTQQKINIGNYPQPFQNAFNIISTGLTKVTDQIKQEAAAGNDVSKLVAQQNALKTALSLVNQEFSSTTARQNAFKEAGKEIADQFGTQSDIFAAYAQNVAAGTAENKKLNDSLSDVSTKAKGASGALGGIFSSLRGIAAALPGIGFAGLIGLLLDPIIKALESLDLFKAKVGSVADVVEQFNGVLTDSTGGLVKIVEEVNNMNVSFDEANKGFVSEADALKQYNATLGQSLGIADSFNEAQQKTIANSAKLIQLTLLQTAAQVAGQKAAQQLVDAQIKAAQTPDQFDPKVNTASFAKGFFQRQFGDYADANQNINDARKAQQAKVVQDAKDESSVLLNIQQGFLKQAEDIQAGSGILFSPKTLQEQVQPSIDTINLQIEALTRYGAKQQDIANEEKNSYGIRRQALLQYIQTVQQIDRLQLNRDLLPTTGNAPAEAQVRAQGATKALQDRISGQNSLEKLDDEYYQRRIKANYDALQAQLDDTVATNQAIYTDESNGLDQRLDAYKAYVAAQKGLADAEYTYSLQRAGFNQNEIDAINAGLAVSVQGKKITIDELEALEVQHDEKMVSLASAVGKNVFEITTSYAKKQEQLALETNKALESTQAQNAYQGQLAQLNKDLTAGLISVTQYNAKRNGLEQVYADQRLAIQVDEDQAKLDNLKKNQESLLEQELYADAGLQGALASGDKTEIDANQKKLDAIKNAEIQNAADIAKIQQKAANDQVALQEALTKQLVAAKTQEKNDTEKLETAAVDLVKQLFTSQYEAKIAEIQAEITAVEAKSAAEVTAEQSTTDDAQTQADKIANINARAAQQEAQLQQQENEQKKKEAEVDRIAQVATIIQKGIQTEFDLFAKAASAEATGALLAADPVTAAYAPIAFASAAAISADEIIVAATSAAEIAAILASPLPAYKYGGKHKQAGFGKVGDGGRSELLEFSDGGLAVTPATDTYLWMPEDTTIHADAAKALSNMKYSGFRKKPEYLPGVNKRPFEKLLLDEQRRGTREIVGAIEKETTQMRRGFAGMKSGNKYGPQYEKWLARALRKKN